MLKSRRIFPPGGWQFYQPETNWFPPGGLTFEQTVDAIIKHRKANPRFHLPDNPDYVANELDEYTCLRIQGDSNYCTGAGSPDVPKKAPGQPSRLPGLSGRLASAADASKKIKTGVSVLLDWLGHGGKAVDKQTAGTRASICVTCPLNQPGELTSFFTVPASELIRKQLRIKNEMNLETMLDDRLGVCKACLCPLKLKVWCPLEYILKKMTVQAMGELDRRCWMISEKP